MSDLLILIQHIKKSETEPNIYVRENVEAIFHKINRLLHLLLSIVSRIDKMHDWFKIFLIQYSLL